MVRCCCRLVEGLPPEGAVRRAMAAAALWLQPAPDPFTRRTRSLPGDTTMDLKPQDSNLPAGKRWRLRRMADAAGYFSMVAIDQRPPIFATLARALGIAAGTGAVRPRYWRSSACLAEGFADRGQRDGWSIRTGGYPAAADVLNPGGRAGDDAGGPPHDRGPPLFGDRRTGRSRRSAPSAATRSSCWPGTTRMPDAAVREHQQAFVQQRGRRLPRAATCRSCWSCCCIRCGTEDDPGGAYRLPRGPGQTCRRGAAERRGFRPTRVSASISSSWKARCQPISVPGAGRRRCRRPARPCLPARSTAACGRTAVGDACRPVPRAEDFERVVGAVPHVPAQRASWPAARCGPTRSITGQTAAPPRHYLADGRALPAAAAKGVDVSMKDEPWQPQPLGSPHCTPKASLRSSR